MRTILSPEETIALYLQGSDEWRQYATEKEIEEMLIRGVQHRISDIRYSPWLNTFINVIYSTHHVTKTKETYQEFKKFLAEFYSVEKADEELERLSLWRQFEKERRLIAAYDESFNSVSDFHALIADEEQKKAYDLEQERMAYAIVIAAKDAKNVAEEFMSALLSRTFLVVQKNENWKIHKKAENQKRLKKWETLEKFVSRAFKKFFELSAIELNKMNNFIDHLKEYSWIFPIVFLQQKAQEITIGHDFLKTLLSFLEHVKINIKNKVVSDLLLYRIAFNLFLDKQKTLCYDEKGFLNVYSTSMYYQHDKRADIISIAQIDEFLKKMIASEVFVFGFSEEIEKLLGVLTNIYRMTIILKNNYDELAGQNVFLQNVQLTIEKCLSYLYEAFLEGDSCLKGNKILTNSIDQLFDALSQLNKYIVDKFSHLPDQTEAEDFLKIMIAHLKVVLAPFRPADFGVTSANVALFRADKAKKPIEKTSVAMKKR